MAYTTRVHVVKIRKWFLFVGTQWLRFCVSEEKVANSNLRTATVLLLGPFNMPGPSALDYSSLVN